MRLHRIIAVATAAELSFAAGAFGLLGAVGGLASGWLDLLNELTMVGLVVSVLALGLAIWLVERDAPYRRWTLASAAVGVAAALLLLGPDVFGAISGLFAHPAPGAPPLKIVQFNLWRENWNLSDAAKVIHAADPDILAVEEVEEISPGEMTYLSRAFPYQFGCRPRFNCGIQIYSKRPARSVEVIRARPIELVTELYFVKAVFDGPDGKPLTVIATHLSWPMPPGVQERQWPTVERIVKSAGPNGVILLGDFNLSPTAYLMHRLDGRMRPLTRHDHLLFTYPATVPRARIKWALPFIAIDHIFATPDLRVTDVKRLGYAWSDHYPIMATVTR